MASLAVYKAALAVFLATTVALGASAYSSQQQMTDLDNKVSSLTGQLSNSTSQVSSRDNEIASLKDQISQLQQKVTSLQTQLDNLHTQTGNGVPLPPYLDRCVTGAFAYHAHLNLSIVINGTSFTIPTGVGIQGSCYKPIHTHATDGVLHVETDVSADYKLGDFFLIWGNWTNDAQQAIFNSTQIFGARAVAGHTLTMTVNGSLDSSFENYVIPRNSGSTVNPCLLPVCEPISIVITYS